MNIIGMFFHAGSKNHGCEAIVRGSLKILRNYELVLFSFNPREDKFFNIPVVIEKLYSKTNNNKKTFKYFFKKIILKIIPDKIQIFLKNNRHHNSTLYDNLLKSSIHIALSIGGDNYCYGGTDLLYFLNNELIKNNKKSVLWGCSIEPTKIKGNNFLKNDLKKYSLITARESLTYNALIENGIDKNTHLFPDPAFLLDKETPTDLPNNFIPNNTVGLNLSPMVQGLERGSNIAYKNFLELIKYIIEKTQMNISLIPHVIIENNNDLKPLTKLYSQFKNTNRICLIDKPYNACQLKGIISQCRFMIAARTHASIAAYSTQVPTLVIGYSVKAKGIAKDIFGDYKDYVLPVQELKEEKEVLEAFKKLMQNEKKIREHYKNFMPKYIEKAWLAGKEVEKLLQN